MESTRHAAIICSPAHDGLMHLDLSRSLPEQDWSLMAPYEAEIEC